MVNECYPKIMTSLAYSNNTCLAYVIALSSSFLTFFKGNVEIRKRHKKYFIKKGQIDKAHLQVDKLDKSDNSW